MKAAYTFKFDQKLLKTLKSEAKKKNRSFNNYVETLLIERNSKIKSSVKMVSPSGDNVYGVAETSTGL